MKVLDRTVQTMAEDMTIMMEENTRLKEDLVASRANRAPSPVNIPDTTNHPPRVSSYHIQPSLSVVKKIFFTAEGYKHNRAPSSMYKMH